VWLDTLHPADRVNLLELYGRSVMLLELGRACEWVDLFVPHALVRCGAQQFKGRAELLDLAKRTIAGEFDLALGPLPAHAHCRHSLSDVSLFAEGLEHASGFAHLNVFAAGEAGAPRWLAFGTYADKLSKCGAGCWRFDSRVLTAAGTMTLQDGPAAASANQLSATKRLGL